MKTPKKEDANSLEQTAPRAFQFICSSKENQLRNLWDYNSMQLTKIMEYIEQAC